MGALFWQRRGSMPSFDGQMEDDQVAWRQAHVQSEEYGWQNRVQRPWILPEHLWEESLWPGIRKGSGNALSEYLQNNGMRQHSGAHNLKSSWTLCANLYFPFRASRVGLDLFASFLRERVASEIASLEAIELEYEGKDDLHPAALLGEKRGRRSWKQTSPDLGLSVNKGQGLILVENKFVEKNFYTCPGSPHYRNRGQKTKNPYPDRCKTRWRLLKPPLPSAMRTRGVSSIGSA